jgi:hypothetical protein
MWLYITHNLTIACFAPIYFIYHHKQSPTNRTLGLNTGSRSVIMDNIRQIRYIPICLVLGLMIPFSFNGLPSPDVISHVAQQNGIFITIFWPTWVMLLINGCALLDAAIFPDDGKDIRDLYMSALRTCYVFAIVIGAFLHIGIVVMSLSSVIYPGIFAPHIPELFHPLNLLLPTNPPVETIGMGIFNFMKRDQWIGYFSMWLWILKCYQEHEELKIKSWGTALTRFVEVTASMTLLGACGSGALFLWHRDEVLNAQEKKALVAGETKGKK